MRQAPPLLNTDLVAREPDGHCRDTAEEVGAQPLHGRGTGVAALPESSSEPQPMSSDGIPSATPVTAVPARNSRRVSWCRPLRLTLFLPDSFFRRGFFTLGLSVRNRDWMSAPY